MKLEIHTQTHSIRLAVCMSLALCSWSPWASAQTNANDAAAAEQLFIQGRQLLEAGETEQACTQLQASQNLDPGLGTMLVLAHCYERLGKTASAWATFRAAESLARQQSQNERQDIARVRAALLEPKLARLELRLVQQITDSHLSFTRDGVELPREAALQAVPVDPGSHQLTVSAPGMKAWTHTVLVPTEPGTTRVDVPPLEPLPVAATSEAALSSSELRPASLTAPRSSAQPVMGFVVAGTGLAGLTSAGVLSLLAKRSYDDSLSQCRTEQLCAPGGLALRRTAEKRADLATIVAAAGGGLLATGIVLVWLSPKNEATGIPEDSVPHVGKLTLGTSVSTKQLGIIVGGDFQ